MGNPSTMEGYMKSSLTVRRVTALAGGLSALIVLLAGSPVFAEGSWSGKVEGVRQGFESRRWTDRNSDSVKTAVTFKNCSWKDPSNRPNSAGYTTVELRQVLTALPDRKLGKKDLWCAGASGDTKDWGDRAAGEYYFSVYGAGGYYDIRTWASPVSVAY